MKECHSICVWWLDAKLQIWNISEEQRDDTRWSCREEFIPQSQQSRWSSSAWPASKQLCSTYWLMIISTDLYTITDLNPYKSPYQQHLQQSNSSTVVENIIWQTGGTWKGLIKAFCGCLMRRQALPASCCHHLVTTPTSMWPKLHCCSVVCDSNE